MDGINDKLRALRKERGMTLAEFGKLINMSPQGLSGIEKHKHDINSAKIMELCKKLKLSPNELFGIGEKGLPYVKEDGVDKPAFDPDDIYEKYYRLDDYGKELVQLILDRELDRIENDSTSRVIFYPIINDTVEVDFYPQSAGMGRGQDVNAPFPERIEIAKSEMPEYTDFVIRVTGDSMLPTFEPGDLLYVQKAEHLNPGDIGVFVLDGETMVKEYGKGMLISHNKKYEPIVSGNSCLIQGRVIGKLNRKDKDE